MTQAADALDVVGMVVCNEQMVHLRHTEPIVLEMFFQRAYSHACIYEKTIVLSIQEVAIATASATK